MIRGDFYLTGPSISILIVLKFPKMNQTIPSFFREFTNHGEHEHSVIMNFKCPFVDRFITVCRLSNQSQESNFETESL